MENIFVVVEIDVFRYFSFLYCDLINEPLLLFGLFKEFWLEESTTVHEIFLYVSKDSVDSLSIILFGVFLLDFCNLFEFVVLLKAHIELVGMEGFHSV